MSNRLKPVQVDAIRLLWERGWSRRRIARELGINRETVNRYVHQWTAATSSADPPGSCESNPAKLHIGSTVEVANPAKVHIGSEVAPAAAIQAESNPANVQVGSEGRLSSCWVYRALIQDKLDQGLTAQRIF